MSFTVSLPDGLEKKTIAIDNVTVDLFDGQAFNGGKIVSLFPQYFTEAKATKAPKAPAKKVEEKLEILTEAPTAVEVEIVAEDKPAPKKKAPAKKPAAKKETTKK